jgi:hypothetical protein
MLNLIKEDLSPLRKFPRRRTFQRGDLLNAGARCERVRTCGDHHAPEKAGTLHFSQQASQFRKHIPGESRISTARRKGQNGDGIVAS